MTGEKSNTKDRVATTHLGWVKGLYRRWLRHSERQKLKRATEEEKSEQ